METEQVEFVMISLANLDNKVGRGTVANVLKANGAAPAPEPAREKHIRGSTFLKAHWKVFASSDLFSVEVWTPRGSITCHVLFVIGSADRVVHVARISNRPAESWMLQIGRHLLDADDGVLAGYLIVDRDKKYSKRFRDFIAARGTEVIGLPPLSPNLNACAERFVRSINEKCVTKMIFIGQGSLRRALTENMTHFHEERNHQGLENRLIRERPAVAANDASIHRRTRLGGMLSYYHRIAA